MIIWHASGIWQRLAARLRTEWQGRQGHTQTRGDTASFLRDRVRIHDARRDRPGGQPRALSFRHRN